MHALGAASLRQTAPPLANGVVAGADVAVAVGADTERLGQPASQARDGVGHGAWDTWWGEPPLSFRGHVSSPLTSLCVAQSAPYSKRTSWRPWQPVTVTV